MADLAWRCRSTAYVARATRAVQQLAHASARLMTSFDAGSGGSAEVMGPDPDQEVERERAYRECREVGVPPPLEQAKSSKSINVPSVSSRICHTRTRYARKNPLIPSRGLGGESSKKNRLRNPPPPNPRDYIGTGSHEGLQWRRAAAVLCAPLVSPQNGRRDRSVSLPGEQRAPRHHLRSAVAFVALGALVVVRHLQAGPPEAALDVEALVVLAAVEDRLVAARLYGDVVERLDEAQAQLLALLVLGDGDVLDVPDRPEIVDAGVANGPLALFS